MIQLMNHRIPTDPICENADFCHFLTVTVLFLPK
jgi:hypothetical protein